MKETIPPVEYLKSSLSMNTGLGCPLGCDYCVLDEIMTKGVEKILAPDKLVDILTNHRLFVSDVTPIAINNKTDPLLPQIKDDTFEVLRLLDERNLRNPRILISKLPLTPEDLKRLEESEALTYFIVSLSDLPRPLEKVHFETSQLESFQTLENRRRVKSLHYWRPIIRGLNDSDQSIRDVLGIVGNYCDGSIISGLRVTPRIKERMENYGADLRDWGGDIHHKHLPVDIQQKILLLRDQYSASYPIFRHTSCAISALRSRPDYGLNYLKGEPDCLQGCFNQSRCHLRNKRRIYYF